MSAEPDSAFARNPLARRYRRVRLLGRGSAGEVWECVDEAAGVSVAVKTLRLRAGGSEAAARFCQEARMVGLLPHAGVAQVHDAGVDEETAYVVTELLPGPALAEMLAERGRLPVDEAVWYMDQLLGALGAAHATGVVHRRLKPSNVLLDEQGQLRVVDFGVAVLHESGALSSTVDKATADEAHYLAPEQVAGEAVDARTDLYAAGAVFTEMLTGKPPFVGGSALELADKHIRLEATRVATARPEVWPVFDELAAGLLAKNPADRPASAEEARLSLRRGESFASGVVPGSARPVTPDAARGPARRWSWLLPVYVVVALALITGVLAFLLTRSGMSF